MFCMARHSGTVLREREKGRRLLREYAAVSASVVGILAAAALIVLLLLTKSQLSEISFAVSALEQELEMLEAEHDKLVIAHTQAYSLQRVERYAVETLGMMRPEPSQYRYIYMADDSQQRTEETD